MAHMGIIAILISDMNKELNMEIFFDLSMKKLHLNFTETKATYLVNGELHSINHLPWEMISQMG